MHITNLINISSKYKIKDCVVSQKLLLNKPLSRFPSFDNHQKNTRELSVRVCEGNKWVDK